MDDDGHLHGHGMADDLPRLNAMVARRRALRWIAGAGTAALVVGRGEEGRADPAGSPRRVASGCVADPLETGGPFPADGTNRASGTTSNALTAGGIVRSDLRASFLGTTTVATGVRLDVTLTLVDVAAACMPLAGHAVYLWQCDREGHYSLYTAAAESYLRGVQVTDRDGRVTFTTIFPACYDGRWPHQHVEIFPSLAHALGGRDAILTSQLAMPAALCGTIYADRVTYPSSAARFATIALATDMVFGDNTAAQLAQQTPLFTGSVAAGYAATALIGLAR